MSFDWSCYTGNLDWLPGRTLYVTRHGSHAYGTSTPESDLDLRGVAVAPRSYYLGFKDRFEQAVQHTPDLTIFELRKFVSLASECNPNVIEILFTDQEDRLLLTPLGERLIRGRNLFLSQRAKHTFSGYAVSQLKRINTHYRWLRNPPTSEPVRADFGLPDRTVIPADQLAAVESAIRAKVNGWAWRELEHLSPAERQSIQDEFYRRLVEITQWSWDSVEDRTWNSAALGLGLDSNFIELLDRERRYTARRREWTQYQEWKTKRNPARAALEERFGYDTKHGMHLVRLLRMCREILTDGSVLVRRPDAAELLEIRNGSLDYHALVSWAEKQDAELRELADASPLPKRPNLGAIDALCIEIVEASI